MSKLQGMAKLKLWSGGRSGRGRGRASYSQAPAHPGAEEADALWRAAAHPAQLPPDGDWRTWLFQGGRGAGKTRAGAEWLAAMAARQPKARFALVGATLGDVREVMIAGPSGLCSLPHRTPPVYEPSRRRLVFASGAVAYAFSAEEPERLRGPQFDAAWADEFAAWAKPAAAVSNLRLGLRRGVRPRLCVTTTPRPLASLRSLRAEPGCSVSQAGSQANADHLAPGFLDHLTALYGGTRLMAQEIEGALLDVEGALFPAEAMARARAAGAAWPVPHGRTVVAVDPPAGLSGQCGIVAAARAGDRFFVLADRSLAGLSALGWARRAVETAVGVGAGEIVAEGNQGGEMVRDLLELAAREAGAGVAVQLVRAGRSKVERALPVSALYEQGRVAHVVAMPALEEEMMGLGTDDAGRLDRADAVVWALSALAGEDDPRLVLL